MIDLTIAELKAKIEQVKTDLSTETGRKYEVLCEYKAYLEDELKFLESNK